MAGASAVPTHRETAADRVFTGIKVAIVAALAGAMYAAVLQDLASEWWTQSEASYGMLIPPFAAYMLYLKRNDIFLLPAREDSRGVVFILLACVMYLAGRLASEFFLSRISFVILLAGLVWTFWGVARLRSMGFILMFLMTMVPPPAILYNAAAAPLQLFASRIATDLAQLLGVSIFRDGNVIHLASISLGVAEACSGLHSLSALLVASLLLGFLENVALPGRVAIFVLAAPLAIAVNVFRVTGTAILADWKPELALGYYHTFSGWLVFVLGFGILWGLAKAVFRFSRCG